jgi:hypothetical protein
MIDDRTSAGPRAWHPTYRIDHVSPSRKKPVTVASISDAEREATPRARARRRELQARTDRRAEIAVLTVSRLTRAWKEES